MTSQQRTTKDDPRQAAKAAVARAADANRRRHRLSLSVAGVAALGIIAAAIVVFGRTDSAQKPAPSAAPEPTATSAVPFPSLPAGADPALSTKPMVSAGSGELTKLAVTTMIQGSGPVTAAGQTIVVNYVGVSYPTGLEFDSSWTHRQALPFHLGAGEVIPGFDQGLVGVKVGSRVQLDLPSNLAYGDHPGNGAPAGPLRFVVDVLDAQ